MKPVIVTIKNARGRITGYTASIGVAERFAATKPDAIALCEKSVIEALDRLQTGAKFDEWRGVQIVVSPDLSGWRYWISSFSSRDYSINGYETLASARSAAFAHAAQNLWTHDEDDDRAFLAGLPTTAAKEVSSWIAWQRRYREGIEAGMSDNDARSYEWQIGATTMRDASTGL